jgi:hypothetical protein
MIYSSFGVFNRVVWNQVMNHADPGTWSVCMGLNKDFSRFLDQKVLREQEDLEVMARKGREWHIWKLCSREDLRREVKLLAEYGLGGLVRMHITGWNKNDILHGASMGGHMELAKWAVENGAADWNGALLGACEVGQMEMAKWTVEMGATDWNWAFYGACREGQMEMAKWLAEKGAADWNGALYQACDGDQMEMAKWAVEMGATDWNWALYGACIGGLMEMARWLVEKGATECEYCGKPVETHL